MGQCQEFGAVIAEGCDHGMLAAVDHCRCDGCGVVCRGRFDSCAAVWVHGQPTIPRAPGRVGAAPPVLTEEKGPVARKPRVTVTRARNDDPVATATRPRNGRANGSVAGGPGGGPGDVLADLVQEVRRLRVVVETQQRALLDLASAAPAGTRPAAVDGEGDITLDPRDADRIVALVSERICAEVIGPVTAGQDLAAAGLLEAASELKSLLGAIVTWVGELGDRVDDAVEANAVEGSAADAAAPTPR